MNTFTSTVNPAETYDADTLGIDWDRLETETFTGSPAFVLTMDVAIDLFAGPGGWDEGIRMLGERTGRPDLAKGVLGFEFEPTATATARANGHKRCHGDLSKVNPAHFSAPLLIASPPCQGFSPAGKGRGRLDFERLEHAIGQIRLWLATGRTLFTGMSPESAIEWLGTVIADPKSALILEPLRWAIRMAALPRAIAQEQVRTCLPIWEAMADVYRDLGYSVWTGIVHSEEYGVPQTRQRAVLLASLDVDVTGGPVATHGKYNARRPMADQHAEAAAKGLLPWVTMADALGTEPVAAVPGDTSWVSRRPSVTIVGSFRPDIAAAPGWRKPGDGPRQNTPGSVFIDVEQAGVLQSFPADYVWEGPVSKQYQQAGNAVPCLMAAALVETVEV